MSPVCVSLRRLGTLWIALSATLLVAAAAGADTMNYQGYLDDGSGSPLPGPANLGFRIYDVPSGGSALWTESFASVPLESGVFTVILGQTDPLDETIFDGRDRWIETSIDGAPLLPRRPFTSVPHSIYAKVAEVALNGAPDGDWAINGSNVYNTTHKIGIGDAAPLSKLHVQTQNLGLGTDDVGGNSDIVLESTDANLQLFSDNGGSTGSALGLIEVQAGNIFDTWSLNRLTSGAGSKLRMRFSNAGGGTSVMTLLPTNRVGIGTEVPANELSVVGDVDASTYQATADLGEFVAPTAGGVYRDNVVYAWAYVQGNGTIVESFGVDRVTRSASGQYSVFYETSLTGASCPMVMAQSANNPVLATVGNFGPLGCDVKVRYDQGTSWLFTDNNFFIQVMGRP